MPRGDRTGPMGAGSRTGRGAGWCAGYGVPGYANPAPGLGAASMPFGMGYRGGGRGWRNMYYATGLPGWARAGYAPAPPTPEAELSGLRAEAAALGDQIAAINERIRLLEGEQPE